MRNDLRGFSPARLDFAAPRADFAALPERARAARDLDDSLCPAALHEVYAASAADAASLAGFAALAAASLTGPRRLVWIRHADLDRETGAPYGPGLADLGLDPAALVLARARSVKDVLQAGLEAARHARAAMVLIEFRGPAPAYDLLASRRLLSAARASGGRVFLLRSEADPAPSAADTRWRVAAARSAPLDAVAPGAPAFSLTLLRDRRGREGRAWTLEWSRDRVCFEIRAGRLRAVAPPLSVGMVSLPVGREDAPERRAAG